jgi:uncharacterized protein YcbK (DUF882 family)
MRWLVGLAVLHLAALARAEPDLPKPELSKKERFLAEKHSRAPVCATRAPHPGTPAALPITLRNLWTHESLPVDPARPPPEDDVDRFLRCHFTNQATRMDPRLVGVVMAAAKKFSAQVVEVVSGFRAPKYNLFLRKKGHEVARDSQHPKGHAVDFRLPGLATTKLLRFVRSLRLGGVGYYPASAFVHADVGPRRFWKGH